MLGRSAVELRNVSFSRGDRTVIDDLSLSIPEGASCAVLGPNGGGKTTLLHLMLGWLRPSAGTVLAGGRDISLYPARRRGRLLSLLPQTENISFDYTVTEYILLGRAPHLGPLERPGGEDAAIAAQALDLAGGGSLSGRHIPTLSGGERQTVLLARAISQQPAIILMDEPANHLDPAGRRRIRSVIGSLKNNGVTVVFTSHEPADAAASADYLILMPESGRAECGPFEELFTEKRLSELYGIEIKIHRPAGPGSTGRSGPDGTGNGGWLVSY